MNLRFVAFLISVFFLFVSCTTDDYKPLSVVQVDLTGTWESIAEKYELFDKKGKLIDADETKHEGATEKETYTFNSDKTGTVKSYEDGEWSTAKFTYTVNNKVVVVSFKEAGEGISFEFDMEFEYTITNNKLYLSIASETEEGIEKATLELIKK